MIIIFAESGKGTSIDNDSVPTLSSLKEYLYTRTNIPIDQQILLSPSGIQTKDTNYAPTLSTDTFILFNRQHLERNNDLLSSSDNKSGTLQQEAWLNTLVDKHMPVMVDTSPLTRHYTALTSLVNKYKQRQQDWSNLECTTFCHQWIKTIQRFAQEVANISSQHGLLADTVTQELKMQTMALKAALSNLDNHIKSTYHSQTKFERIAKKKLAKHTQSMALVDRDLSFMHEIKLHSQIQTPLCSPPFESQLQYLIDCFSITPMASLKAQLQEDYDRLVKKTHQLNDKMKTIYRQSQQINIQHTGKATLGDIQSYLTMINDVWHHLELRWKRLDDDERMKHIIGDTVNRMEQQMYFLNDSGTNDSREYKDDDTNTEMESTIKKTDITDIPDEDLAKRLLLYESFIRTALETILEEKRNVMVNFFRYLQTISHLEESIANLFLSLRHLGNDIKQLGQRTEQLETVSNGIIEGYGLMLIELWRRNQYHQIISKNADLLTGLFSAFASSERQYRAKFQTDICMIDGLESLLLGNTKIKDNICIIPFIYKDFINDEPSCTTIPALDITLAPQHQTPSDRNNKAIVLLEPPLICKKDVEGVPGTLER
ncbi:hypothetical protein BC941DRAFT_104162 [Chlamydoabsidia padenii]|nr:hypothetical protein BC941DRAFT_104162 [Chlamydoabsidia padenii]